MSLCFCPVWQPLRAVSWCLLRTLGAATKAIIHQVLESVKSFFLCSLRSVVFQQMTWLDLLYYTIPSDCASFYFDFAIRPQSSPPFIYSSRENIRRHSRSSSFCSTREREEPSNPLPLRHFDPAAQRPAGHEINVARSAAKGKNEDRRGHSSRL